MTGEFSVNDSLWYAFSLKKPGCNLLFDRKEIVLPDGMAVGRIDLSKSHNFLILELRDSQQISRRREEPEKKPDKSFDWSCGHGTKWKFRLYNGADVIGRISR